jgi:hypothetical protein
MNIVFLTCTRPCIRLDAMLEAHRPLRPHCNWETRRPLTHRAIILMAMLTPTVFRLLPHLSLTGRTVSVRQARVTPATNEKYT